MDTQIISSKLTDDELRRLNQERSLNLPLEDLYKIRDYFRFAEDRDLTDAELEALAQTWSEHCAHRTMKALIHYENNGRIEKINSLFDTYIKAATKKINKDWCVSVFEDNAGIITFDEEYNIIYKVETHNSPSALEPFGGAITGILGVQRDVFSAGRGARAIANTDILCFANPNYNKKLPKRVLHPGRIIKGVCSGIEAGGNKMGIPVVNGAIRFDNLYLGVPLVFCGTIGIAPAGINAKPSHIKTINSGDLIVMVGGRVGKDGLKGATMSSAGIDESTPGSTVQVGAPYPQKKMADFLLEARDLGLYTAIQDCGAGGLSSAVGELAPLSGGCSIQLELVPLKYPGLAPWEILLSEAQERCIIAVPCKYENKLQELASKHDIEATAIGLFINTGRFVAYYDNKIVADLDLDFLLHGYPQLELKASWSPPQINIPKIKTTEHYQNLCGKPWNELLHQLLSRLNICSKEPIIRQYDHEVQGQLVIKPLIGANNDGPSNAAVIWPLEVQKKNSKRGIVIANGINQNYGYIDTYWMAANNIDEAIRNTVCIGANPNRIALLDNFAWSESHDPYRLAQLVRTCKALYDYATIFETPFISGKDSMFNSFKLDGIKLSAPPTLLISALGIIEDITKAVTMDLKEPGNLLYLLGKTHKEFAGSEYWAMLSEEIGEPIIDMNVPKVNAIIAKKTYQALHKAIVGSCVASAHDLSEGGLAVAAAEMAIAGNLGLCLRLGLINIDNQTDEVLLFSESPSRILVEVPQLKWQQFENIMRGIPYKLVGWVAEKSFSIRGINGKELLREDIDVLRKSWQQPII